MSLFVEFVPGPNPAQARWAASSSYLPEEGGPSLAQGWEYFYSIPNWGIKIHFALDYCVPEKLWVTKANGRLDSQKPLLSGILGLPPSGPG